MFNDIIVLSGDTMLITSINNDKIKDTVKLKDKKYRDKFNLFYVEGIDLVYEAYKNGLLTYLYILDGERILFDDIPYCFVSIEVMKKISDVKSSTAYLGICSMKKEETIGKKLVLLDRIQDPGNIGTIIRSAVAFGFDTVVLGVGCADLYNPKVVRSTKGMIFNINIISRKLEEFIPSLDGYNIYGPNYQSRFASSEVQDFWSTNIEIAGFAIVCFIVLINVLIWRGVHKKAYKKILKNIEEEKKHVL